MRFLPCILFLLPFSSEAQPFGRADSLRGTLSELRSCFDVTYYKLSIEVFPSEQSLLGHNTIYFKVVQPFKKMQIDLFKNMSITNILYRGKPVKYEREHDAVFIFFEDELSMGNIEQIVVFFNGKPKVSKRPPWDGGFVWEKDNNGKDWVTVACEGEGASLWWPNKDHLSDEPDSMLISCTVPAPLFCKSNGRLREKIQIGNNKIRYDWFVSNPINNYNVSVNIADYRSFSDTYVSKDGFRLDLSYYVMPGNKAKAKQHFKQVHGMLEAFEHYFGKYPFPEDGYSIVETPYWGMEHQSAIAYGNNFLNNKWGFDFIIVHESAHEWWGNNLSVPDHAELWIHEAFGTYAEALLVEYQQGYIEYVRYIDEMRPKVQNRTPIVGIKGVNYDNWGDSDMYHKGALFLHTLRNVFDNDSLWFSILYDVQQEFRHSIITTEEILDFINARTSRDLNPIFQQYLYFPSPPRLEYSLDVLANGNIIMKHRWIADVENFSMPLLVSTSKTEYSYIYPGTEWGFLVIRDMDPKDFKLATELFYIDN